MSGTEKVIKTVKYIITIVNNNLPLYLTTIPMVKSSNIIEI